MKRFIAVLTILACVLAAPVAAADAKFENMQKLFEYWEANGYPDSVGSVFSTDGSMDKLTVLLVGDVNAGADEIRALLVDDSGLSFGAATYSHNALKAVNDEIVANYMGKDAKVYTVGIGWASADGAVTGFGESKKEARVVVSVDRSIAAEYANRFYELYGDKVVVQGGDAVVLADSAAQSNNRWLLPLLISMILITGAGILFFRRARPTLAMQAAGGAVVTKSAPMSRRQVEAAVKKSGHTPRDEVFYSILNRIHNGG